MERPRPEAISWGSATAPRTGAHMSMTSLTHARRGLSALELGLLTFSIAIIVAVTLVL